MSDRINITQASEILGLTKVHVKRLARQAQINHFRDRSGRIFFTEAMLLEFSQFRNNTVWQKSSKNVRLLHMCRNQA